MPPVAAPPGLVVVSPSLVTALPPGLAVAPSPVPSDASRAIPTNSNTNPISSPAAAASPPFRSNAWGFPLEAALEECASLSGFAVGADTDVQDANLEEIERVAEAALRGEGEETGYA